MTDQDSEATNYPSRDGRVFFRYDDDGPVSLPGYLDARPGVVDRGTVFSVPEDEAGDLVGDRFVATDPPAVVTAVVDENATIAELLDLLPDDARQDAPSSPKSAVVEYVDSYLRANPAPPDDTNGSNE